MELLNSQESPNNNGQEAKIEKTPLTYNKKEITPMNDQEKANFTSWLNKI